MLTKFKKEELHELSDRIEKSFCKGTFYYDYEEIDKLNILIHEHQYLIDYCKTAREHAEKQDELVAELKEKYERLQERHNILVEHAGEQLCLLKALVANPPLTFEKLKRDMWFWDNKRKQWWKAIAIDTENQKITVSPCMYVAYEEGRYFEKQVYNKENE